MSGLLAAAAGVLVAGGLLLIGAGLYGTTAPVTAAASRRVRALLRPAGVRRRWRREWSAAIVAALAVLLITGVPAAAAVTAAAVAGVPALFRSVGAAAGEIDRAEALQTWVRRLSDLLSTNSELTRMLVESARSAPAALAGPLAELAVRLDAGWPVESALRGLSDDLDSASGDLVVAALILGMRDRGGGLAEVLTRLADTIAEDVKTRRAIEADRAKPRTTARMVMSITLIAAGGMAILNPEFLEPYASPAGQVALLVIAVYMAGCLLWLRKLTLPSPEPRFLTEAGVR